MTRRDHPSVLEHLQVGGLNAELVREFKARDRHQKRRPCRCASCQPDPLTTAIEAAEDEDSRP